MLSAMSHIGLEFLTNFLNMSKLQNRQNRHIFGISQGPVTYFENQVFS